MGSKVEFSIVIPSSKIFYKFAVNKFTVCYQNF